MCKTDLTGDTTFWCGGHHTGIAFGVPSQTFIQWCMAIKCYLKVVSAYRPLEQLRRIQVWPAGRGETSQGPYYSRGLPGDDRYGLRMDERWGNGRQYAPREDAHDRCVVLSVMHSAATRRHTLYCGQSLANRSGWISHELMRVFSLQNGVVSAAFRSDSCAQACQVASQLLDIGAQQHDLNAI